MENSDNNEKPRVLRAKDILPPYDKIIDPDPTDSDHLVDDSPADKADEVIPKFDLAQQILAEQRKIAATKRKRSSNTTPILEKEEKSFSPLSQGKKSLSEEILAQIIARDIKNFCTGVSAVPH
jgi:hypothetical protein